MGFRYSREDLAQVKSLVDDGLTSREIAHRLNRSEPAIRNIRYHLNLRKEAEDGYKALQRSNKELETQVEKLTETAKLQIDNSARAIINNLIITFH